MCWTPCFQGASPCPDIAVNIDALALSGRKAFKKQAAQFNKAQERMTAERSEAAYMAMLNHQMSKTTSTMNKCASS